MSGYAGIVNFDGVPVDRPLLERLTESLAFRGPDGQSIRCDGNFGLGHCLLRTGPPSPLEAQPLSLHNRLWIVAHARMDARAELLASLRSAGANDPTLTLDAPDALLLLHAYDVWGQACVEHLLGDFSFAIWDARAQKLFCARDQFGVRPFFYARIGQTLVFSNTLNCVRRHPGVSRRLNDLAIADFLLFDSIRDLDATSFADIRRLPPAHTLTAGADAIATRRYWTLPAPAVLTFRREEEGIARFREIFDTAVSDRLRGNSAAILMSGGLDSTTVAAGARRVFTRRGISGGLSAHTHVFDSLIRHEERHYAALAAQALQMPIRFTVLDDCRLFGTADKPEFHTPEPVHCAWPDTFHEEMLSVASDSPLCLTGLGADPAFSGRITVYFRQLLAAGRLARAFADAFRYVARPGRLSRLYLRKRWEILSGDKRHSPSFPPWLNPEFEKRLHLRDRWEDLQHGQSPPPGIARPEAWSSLTSSLWPNVFEQHDAGFTRVPVEVAHPFFDLRLLHFLLGLPHLPFCSDKQLLRGAFKGELPAAVLLRRKTPLEDDPTLKLLARPESVWIDQFPPSTVLEPYVAREKIPSVRGEEWLWRAQVHLRPLSLHYWLQIASGDV